MANEKCACEGAYLDKFIRPVILLALYEQPMHGFMLLKVLVKNPALQGEEFDPTGLYRALKRMETDGLLASHLEEGVLAQRKRVYEITAEGKECLKTWRDTLMKYRTKVDDLLAQIERQLAL